MTRTTTRISIVFRISLFSLPLNMKVKLKCKLSIPFYKNKELFLRLPTFIKLAI